MKKTRYLVQASVIGALYAALTIVLAPISYGPLQFRVSEVFTVLPIFTTAAVPGLTIGCIIANLMGGYGLLDVILGSLATLFGALGTYYLRKRTLLAPLPPVVFNGIIIGPMLYFLVPDSPALLFNVLTVGLGELVICYGLGIPLIYVLRKYPKIFR